MKKLLSLVLGFLPFIFPAPSYAHAFGQLYTLPVPIWLYLYGGVTVVLISFLLIGVFIRQPKSGMNYPSTKLTFLSFLDNATLIYIIKLFSIMIFPLIIFAGFFGNSESVLNFATVFVWIIFLLGFTYFTALFGNLWEIINPWKILSEVYETVTEKQIKGLKKYPSFLGVLPAFIFYFLFIQAELLGNGANPYFLSTMIIIYSLVTFIGIWLFGKNTWLSHGEFLTLFYRLISKCSILEKRKDGWYLRPPFVGLLGASDNRHAELGSASHTINSKFPIRSGMTKKNFPAFSPTLIIFILFMLSSTAFDGFRATQSWWNLYAIFLPLEPLFGTQGSQIIQSFLLFLSPFFFMVFFLITIFIMKLLVKTKSTFLQLSNTFIFSLIPIALVYHIAHYYTLLFIQGQSMISLISDPLNRGWNLFGTINYTVNPGIFGANVVWNTQVFFIVSGHIAAVYMGHVIALKVFPKQKDALISQIPMLILMVFYTMFGLWILSQPLRLGA